MVCIYLNVTLIHFQAKYEVFWIHNPLLDKHANTYIKNIAV